MEREAQNHRVTYCPMFCPAELHRAPRRASRFLRAAAFLRRGDHQDGGGAGDGNRTRVTRLEVWCSTIELHRRVARPEGPGCENRISVSLRTSGLYRVEHVSDDHGIPPLGTGERRPDRIKLHNQRNELLHGGSPPLYVEELGKRFGIVLPLRDLQSFPDGVLFLQLSQALNETF